MRSAFVAAILCSALCCGVGYSREFELMGDQVAEGSLSVSIKDVFFLGAVQVGELANAAGRGDTKRMQQLVDEGVSVNGLGQRAMTPLLWALGKRNLKGFVWLLDHGADPNLVSCCDTKRPQLSPMAMAAQGDAPEFLQALLDHAGDPNLRVNDAEQTPIFFAVALRRMRNIEILIAHHADLNHVERKNDSIAAFGLTPLESAVSARQFEIALILLRAGADPRVKDRSGRTAIDTVMQFGNRGLVTPTDNEAYLQLVQELQRFAPDAQFPVYKPQGIP